MVNGVKGDLITDPELIKQLNASAVTYTPQSGGAPVTDPTLIAHLNASAGMAPQSASANAPPNSALQDLSNSAPVNFILGAGDAGQHFLANLINLGGANLPLAKTGEGLPYDIGNIAGDLATFMIPMAGTERGLAALSKLGDVPSLANAASALLQKGALPAAGRMGIAGTGYGALMNPDHRLLGALIGGGTSGVGGAIGEKIAGMLPSRYLASRTELSPEEIRRNVEVSRGTNTPLGDILESPDLKHTLENYLSKLTLSNVYPIFQKNKAIIGKKGEELLSNIGRMDEQNPKLGIQDALKSVYKEAQGMKRNYYNEVSDLAEKSGVKIGRNNLSNSAQDTLDSIEQSPELKREISSKLLEDLKAYANPENANNLKLTNIFRGKLGDKASEAYQSGNQYEYGIYKNLQDSLSQDIEESIPKDVSNPLRQKYDEAQNFYREKIAPFDDPDISKFVRKGGDPDTILQTFIAKGKNDRGVLLNKLMSKLPEEDKSLVQSAYLSQAMKEGKFDPMKLRSLYSNLGQTQREALFPESGLRGSLEDYAKLVGMNTESLTSMFNPKTGFRDMMIKSAAHGFPAALGYSQYGIPGALAGFALPEVIGRYMTKALTSPKMRDKLIESMLKVKASGKSPPAYTGTGASLGNALGQFFTDKFIENR